MVICTDIGQSVSGRLGFAFNNYLYLGWKDEAKRKAFEADFFCFREGSRLKFLTLATLESKTKHKKSRSLEKTKITASNTFCLIPHLSVKI